MLDDSQDPLSSWSYDELLSMIEEHSLPINDLYGALHFHLISQFRLFASSLKSRELQFTLLGKDVRGMSTMLQKSVRKNRSPQKFDRVGVSNMGIEASLAVLSGMLRPYNENRHSTLLTALNYPLDTPTNEPLKTSISSETKQLIDALLRKEGVVPGPDLKGPVIMKILAWTGYLEDCTEQWREYVERQRFDAFSRRGMKDRTKRTIVEWMPFRVNQDLRIKDIFKNVKRLDVTGLTGHECYVEWVRAG